MSRIRSIMKYDYDEQLLTEIRTELARRQQLLIGLAHSPNSPMEVIDREGIINVFEKNLPPKKPTTIPELMKFFLTSCFSYSPLRKYLTRVTGHLPSQLELPSCLNKVYDEAAFLDDRNWFPLELARIAARIQSSQNFNLDSKQFKPRMIVVMITGGPPMAKRLSNGLEPFYLEVENACENPDKMWNYVTEFSAPIHQVGASLITDFLKDIGFDRFVKIDHHLKNEFPKLLPSSSCRELSLKQQFTLAIDLSEKLGITPSKFDNLLYQWGRYKNYLQ